MVSPEQLESLRQSLSRAILDHLTDILLQYPSIDRLSNPVLRFEAFIENGYCERERGDRATPTESQSPSTREPVVSRLLDLSGILTPETLRSPVSAASADARIATADVQSPDSSLDAALPAPSVPPTPRRRSKSPVDALGYSNHRKTISALRPARADFTVVEGLGSQRQMQISNHNFPKRLKTQSEVVLSPQESSMTRFVVGIWEQIHGGVQPEPQMILEQWNTATAAATAIISGTVMAGLGEVGGSFNHSNTFCRKVTQASRTCRSIEVIVQARWIEHFESYVDFLAVTYPAMSATKCRKAALMEACNDFGWHEKDMRNKMAVWRGYKEIKDAGGWAALVFAGMGLYRFCKYRIGLNAESMQCLRKLRSRIEVAADTLHPNWRQLLVVVGEASQQRFTGHPHDWVILPDGSDPVPLRSTYLEHGQLFSFEHLEESLVDINAWGGDDPRWIPPLNVAACRRAVDTCHKCGQDQSDDPKVNACHCIPSLFGGPRAPCPVQIFRTSDGRNNGLQALVPFERGATIGEFMGLVTKDLRDVDVMDSSAAGRRFQIWQGRQGNYTRFINHSCKPNAQFENFVWMSTQRTMLVSKGIDSGQEITVDYSGSYWRGLNKQCLCGEGCCRYKAADNR
ncbi:Histone-lysine N-methyltransferase EHMT1 [Pleurostoma richardsiae]|uniref:Histone-lysine N-methyltransferase EHMT1 n=1 Tax=Pleurostoma richardsiae TaxID=41990 RepID=A0AA38VAZ9_9PEZI|nr:Histone-lysine N-methyltransferase EHMT1 [Pleurostoma richardsiae]